jgi:hypothetical protein
LAHGGLVVISELPIERVAVFGKWIAHGLE